MLAIAWQYLTGNAVAATVTDREHAEWPPHPDRVFQSLVASWGDRGGALDERAALEWVERLGPPELVCPGEEDALPAAAPKVYVPVNDTLGNGVDRVRKERYFPRTIVGDAVCALVWRDADPSAHREALSRVLAGVTRIGHSSSLVRAWLSDAEPESRWVPAGRNDPVDVQLRVPEDGRLRGLVRDFADGGANWRRPRTGAWCAYSLRESGDAASGHHSGRLLILRRVAGSPLGAAQTLALTAAIRSRLLRQSDGDIVRALVSGHASDGAPLARPHAAYFPLPFVASTYADGHLLGVAIALPSGSTFDEEEGVFRALARAMDVDTGALEVTLPDERTATFVLEDRPAPPLALRASSWARASAVWATATPLVLDRQPPRGVDDREAFTAEEIARACEHAGFPRPEEVRVLDAPAWLGAPHARALPPLPTKSGLRRRHVHAWLRFARPVRGPVLLGAGRYRGYGLCKPVHDKTEP